MNLLNSVFIAPIVIVGAFASVHAIDYIHGEDRKHLVRFWLFLIATIVSMFAVVFSSEQLSFLLAWEAMGLSSAGLVAFENKEKPVKKATWTYLLACHAGACALMLAGVMYRLPHSYLVAFLLAVIGFGLKIGFPPFHVWLPEAHPAAPAPASAIMSGAMIPLGFYGLLRFFPLVDASGCAYLMGSFLLSLGCVGAIGGMMFALPQANLKRLLAFSSVENMGVIAMALGLAFIAIGHEGCSVVSTAAYAGAIAHILNHAMLKGGLFLGAGSILRQTGTLNQDKLGGLMRRMPKTGSLFVLNALGLAGLPPLNGFLGELVIYYAAFQAIKTGRPMLIVAGFAVMLALALVGGLAVAAYCKAIGAVFLGEPRSESAAKAEETPMRMWVSQVGLFIASILMIPGTWLITDRLGCRGAADCVFAAIVVGLSVIAGTVLLLAARHFLCPRGAQKTLCPTWDCGCAKPTARMAYTGSAFTQPLVDLLEVFLRPRKHVVHFRGHPASPTDAALVTETDDQIMVSFWRPLFTTCARAFQRMHLLQNGSLHFYILMILAAVVVLLVVAISR